MSIPQEDSTKVEIKITLSLPDHVKEAAMGVGNLQVGGRGHRITLPSEAVKVEVLGFTTRTSNVQKVKKAMEEVKKVLDDFKAYTPEQFTTGGETRLTGRVSLTARSVEQGKFREMRERIFSALRENGVDILTEVPFNPQIPIAASSFEPSQKVRVAAPAEWDVKPKEHLEMEFAELPTGDQLPPAMEAEAKKFIPLLSGDKTTLERICGDQEIRRLYRAVYSREMPTKEEIQQLPAEKITGLVQDLAHAVTARNVVLCRGPSSKPISLAEVQGNPEILKQVFQDLVEHKRKSTLERLDRADGELRRLGFLIFPDQQDKYHHLLEDMQTFRSSLPEGIGDTGVLFDRIKKLFEEIRVIESEKKKQDLILEKQKAEHEKILDEFEKLQPSILPQLQERYAALGKALRGLSESLSQKPIELQPFQRQLFDLREDNASQIKQKYGMLLNRERARLDALRLSIPPQLQDQRTLLEIESMGIRFLHEFLFKDPEKAMRTLDLDSDIQKLHDRLSEIEKANAMESQQIAALPSSATGVDQRRLLQKESLKKQVASLRSLRMCVPSGLQSEYAALEKDHLSLLETLSREQDPSDSSQEKGRVLRERFFFQRKDRRGFLQRVWHSNA